MRPSVTLIQTLQELEICESPMAAFEEANKFQIFTSSKTSKKEIELKKDEDGLKVTQNSIIIIKRTKIGALEKNYKYEPQKKLKRESALSESPVKSETTRVKRERTAAKNARLIQESEDASMED
jgi:hypothetical protein